MSWQQDAQSSASHPFREEEVDLSLLHVDEYQRPIDKDHEDKIFKKFDAAAARTLQISLRADESMWIIDGQHTWQVLKRQGFKTWIARIHEELSYEEEAILFVEYNQNAMRPGQMTYFNAHLASAKRTLRNGGTPVDEPLRAHEIDQVLMKYGLAVDGSRDKTLYAGRTKLRAVKLLLEAHKFGGAALLDDVCSIALRAWPMGGSGTPTLYGVTDTFHTRVIPGVTRLLALSTVPLDRQRLVGTLEKVKPEQLSVQVKGNQGASLMLAKILHERYIYGRDVPGTRKIQERNSSLYPVLKKRPVPIGTKKGQKASYLV